MCFERVTGGDTLRPLAQASHPLGIATSGLFWGSERAGRLEWDRGGGGGHYLEGHVDGGFGPCLLFPGGSNQLN